MSDPHGRFGYCELEFDRDGNPTRPEQIDAVIGLTGQVDDLIVVAHGWNNDAGEARDLYGTMLDSVEAQVGEGIEPAMDGRRLGVVGVLWPSKRFAERDLIPGGSAGLPGADPWLAEDLLAQADVFSGSDPAGTLARAAELTGDLARSPDARREFADLLRSLVKHTTPEDEDAGQSLFALDGAELMDRLDDPTLGDPSWWEPSSQDDGTSGHALGVPPTDGSHGGASGLGLPTALLSPGRMLLNFVTYYEMKERAGMIGGTALGPKLAGLTSGGPQLHLVGHSFGARLVTAAAAVLPVGAVSSVSLLQAAFSHYSFAAQWEPGHDGTFRGVVTSGTVTGPMIITHTRNDRAVGIAYAIASRLAGQVAADVGDAASRYGGLGSNGAQRTPEAVDQRLLAARDPYALAGGRVHNLLGDEFVSGHSDVANRPVLHAVLAAMG